MVAINLAIMGKLEEKITEFTFRNKASFGIGKDKRKIAYTMAIDVEIQSVDYNLYENSKANPPIQFYGYCVLVFQDETRLEIPIHHPRQRLYYAVQDEAFRQWRQVVEFYQGYILRRQTDITLGLILAAFDIPPVEIEAEIAELNWIELPLREIYIKCQANTQFKVIYSAWNPITFTDPLTGEFNTGESKQIDGDKDDGLPKDGINPKRNSSEEPFAGNLPVSSYSDIANSGFYQIDDSRINNVNPDNLIQPTYYLRFNLAQLSNGDGDAYVGEVSAVCQSDSVLNVTINPQINYLNTSCGSRPYQAYRIQASGTSMDINVNMLQGTAVVGEVIQGVPSSPPPTLILRYACQ